MTTAAMLDGMMGLGFHLFCRPAMTGAVLLSDASPTRSAADRRPALGVGASPPPNGRRRALHGFVIPSWDDAEAVECVRKMPAS